MYSLLIFQVVLCLKLHAWSAQAIMVKFGTRMGPIEPPMPVRLQQPARVRRDPAPVWEQTYDTPDPNAHWRLQKMPTLDRRPQKMPTLYTQLVYNYTSPQLRNNAQMFVDAYSPQYQPIVASPVHNYLSPAQILSSQNLPGIGIRYFVPVTADIQQMNKVHLKRHKVGDTWHDEIATNEINTGHEHVEDSSALWNSEKKITKRSTEYNNDIRI